MLNRRMILIVLATALAGFAAWGLTPVVQAQGVVNNQIRSVKLIVAYDEDVEKHFNVIPWKAGMTVKDVLEHARSMPAPRGLVYESAGDGERGFLKAIDGLANEGGGQGKRNWLFRVNDTPGSRSFAATEVASGDTIEWRFTSYGWAVPNE